MKVVLDTNVLFAAFAARGLCEAIFEACFGTHEIALRDHILDELRRHLTRKLKMPPNQVMAIEALLRERSTIVTPAPVAQDSCRDLDDLPVLGTAIAGAAAFLVTGDGDLLALGTIDSIPIITSRAFHDQLR